MSTTLKTNLSTSEWQCQACTYVNNGSSEKCDICQLGVRGNVHIGHLAMGNVDKNENTNNEIIKSHYRLCTSDSGEGTDDAIEVLTVEERSKTVFFSQRGATTAAVKIGTVVDINRNNVVDEKDQNCLKECRSYSELEEWYNTDLITCLDHFQCTVCLMDYYPGDGITLKDCLHTFCRDCLIRAVECNTEAEVTCPFGDDIYTCTSVLQEREIKALVTPELYKKHLYRSMKMAEHNIVNTFHCKSLDCVGWCEFGDNAETFHCPVCQQINCLRCKVIHPGISCEEYQEKITSNKNIDATNKLLQNMISKKEVMECPKCQVLLQKEVGCDWLCCAYCRTAICWATRGPRWGPGGQGDRSGGCGCIYPSKKCHPKCRNCH